MSNKNLKEAEKHVQKLEDALNILCSLYADCTMAGINKWYENEFYGIALLTQVEDAMDILEKGIDNIAHAYGVDLDVIKHE